MRETLGVQVVNVGLTRYERTVNAIPEAQANAVAATAGNPAPSIPLVAGAVEILRFTAGLYFSGAAGAASTVYMTPGEGL